MYLFLSKYTCTYSDFKELDEKRDGYKKKCGYCNDLSKCNYANGACLGGRGSNMKRTDNKQGNVLQIPSPT